MKSISDVKAPPFDMNKVKGIAWRFLCFVGRLLWKIFCVTCAVIKWLFLFAFGLGFLAVLHDQDNR